MAEEHDYQVWMEVVRTEGEVGFVIEDGRLKVEAQQESAA